MIVRRYSWACDLHECIYAFENLHTLISYLCQSYHLYLLMQFFKFLFKLKGAHMSKLSFLEANNNSNLLRIKCLIYGQDCLLLHTLSKLIDLSIFLKIWIKHEGWFISRQSYACRVKHTLS